MKENTVITSVIGLAFLAWGSMVNVHRAEHYKVLTYFPCLVIVLEIYLAALSELKKKGLNQKCW